MQWRNGCGQPAGEKEAPADQGRRWSVWQLPLFAGPPGVLQPQPVLQPAACRQLQRVVEGMGRQTLQWQQEAAEALQEVMLGARLRALPLDVLAVIMREGARSMRQACKPFLSAWRDHEPTLRLDHTSLWHFLHHRMAAPAPHSLPPQAPNPPPALLASSQQLARRPPNDRQFHAKACRAPRSYLAAVTALELCDLRTPFPAAVVFEALPQLRALTLHAVRATAGHAAALAPLSSRLTSLRLHDTTLADPQAWADGIGALSCLQHLHVTLVAPGLPPATYGWLPALAPLSRLTHLSLDGELQRWDDAVAQLLRTSWPALAALSLEVRGGEHARQRRPEGPLPAGFAAALAEHTALTSLRLGWMAPPPAPLALSGLELRSLDYAAGCGLAAFAPPGGDAASAELVLRQAAAQASLTRLRMAVAALPAASLPRLLSLAGSLGDLDLTARPDTLVAALEVAAQLPRLRALRVRPEGRAVAPGRPWEAPAGSHLAGTCQQAPGEHLEGIWEACALSRLTQLRVLKLDTQVGDQGGRFALPVAVMQQAGSLTALRELWISGLSTVAAPGGGGGAGAGQLRALSSLQRLTCLKLGGLERGAVGELGELRRLARLQELDLGGWPLDRSDLDLGRRLLPLGPRLRALTLRGVALPEKGRRALRAAAAAQYCEFAVEWHFHPMCWGQ